MKQDLAKAYRADGDKSFGVALVENLGNILSGGGQLAAGINTKKSYSYTETKSTINLNNGTTIAAIIGGCVIIGVVAYAALSKGK